ncbi:hypothetical protein SKAU_G00365910 [Synaphobranchus kaupii]|uniref:Uncharacterized protein n=1 Tax=Synaphobranchus kaupii TaxID=118154 RepID=A0A9Q1EF37_SYNKA|nr:hypothetical protein SKAU_G00365910 [Synaphobranchus kaupii]
MRQGPYEAETRRGREAYSWTPADPKSGATFMIRQNREKVGARYSRKCLATGLAVICCSFVLRNFKDSSNRRSISVSLLKELNLLWSERSGSHRTRRFGDKGN